MTAAKAVAVCPQCGAYGSPELFLGEAARRAAVKAALEMPSPLAEQVLAYVGMWRPLKRGHSWDRVERILSELVPLVRGDTIEHRGERIAVNLVDWQAALDELLVERRPRLDLPLTSHVYLLDIVASAARKRVADAENARASRARGETPLGYSPAHHASERPAADGGLSPAAMIPGLRRLLASAPSDAIRQQLAAQLDAAHAAAGLPTTGDTEQ